MGCIWEKPIQNKWIINIQEMQKYHKNNSDIYVVEGENFMIMRWFVDWDNSYPRPPVKKKKKERIFRKYLVERITCSNSVEVEDFFYHERRDKRDK